MVVNVKPAARLADPAVAEALAWPGDLLEARGWGYEVWSGAVRSARDHLLALAQANGIGRAVFLSCRSSAPQPQIKSAESATWQAHSERGDRHGPQEYRSR